MVIELSFYEKTIFNTLVHTLNSVQSQTKLVSKV